MSTNYNHHILCDILIISFAPISLCLFDSSQSSFLLIFMDSLYLLHKLYRLDSVKVFIHHSLHKNID